MSIEGIFRKNGNIRRLRDLTEAIDRDPSSVDLSQDNPVQLAALLKKFLRDLPDPLMTFKLHRLFIAAQCTYLEKSLFKWGKTLTFLHCSRSSGSRQSSIPPSRLVALAEKPSRYDGSSIRFPEMGCIVRALGRGDR